MADLSYSYDFAGCNLDRFERIQSRCYHSSAKKQLPIYSLSFRISSLKAILDKLKQGSIPFDEMFPLEKLPLPCCFQLIICICNHENKATKFEII